ncbi:MAG: hypothetical protein ACU843_15450 [Gammaproteobacteria bacterium]
MPTSALAPDETDHLLQAIHEVQDLEIRHTCTFEVRGSWMKFILFLKSLMNSAFDFVRQSQIARAIAGS